MIAPILSLHHVTATVADAQDDLRFYTRLLGLRLVKKTVNFDNHGVYHFYYGDERGSPSTLMTTFPYAGEGVPVGTKGAGQVTVTSFSVPPGALDFWRARFASEGVTSSETTPRFGLRGLMVRDPSGLNIELLEGAGDGRTPWVSEGIDPGAAIRGLHGVTLLVRRGEMSARFLTKVLGMEEVDRDGPRIRVATQRRAPGGFLEILESSEAPDAANGLGTVHHVALAVQGDDEQLALRAELERLGFTPTPVRDRQYFRSIYFREPGGVLYEIATLDPGFTVDEESSELGTSLKLPPAAEVNRVAVEEALPSLETRAHAPMTGSPNPTPAATAATPATGPHASGPLVTAGPPLGEARAAMILVHGRGASPRSILELAPALHHPEMAYLAPGAVGNTWYPNSFLFPPEANQPGLSSGLSVIRNLVERVEESGIPRERIILLGFSQGACLTAEFAYRNPGRYGGVVVYSGGLQGPLGTEWEPTGAMAGTPVFLGCSDIDSHIPELRVHETARVFEAMGARVTERIYPGMGHLVNEDEIAWTRELVAKVAGG